MARCGSIACNLPEKKSSTHAIGESNRRILRDLRNLNQVQVKQHEGRYFCVIHFCVIHPIFKEIDEVTQSVIQNFAVTYSVILAVIYSVILFFQWRKVSYSWKMPHQKKSIEIPQVAGVRNTGEFHRLGWCFIDWATAVVGRDDTGQLSVSLISSS